MFISLVMDRTNREKISRAEILSTGCICIARAKRFTKINHILDHKACFNIHKRTEIIQSIFSEHKGIKLKISNRKIYGNISKYSKMNNACLIIHV